MNAASLLVLGLLLSAPEPWGQVPDPNTADVLIEFCPGPAVAAPAESPDAVYSAWIVRLTNRGRFPAGLFDRSLVHSWSLLDGTGQTVGRISADVTPPGPPLIAPDNYRSLRRPFVPAMAKWIRRITDNGLEPMPHITSSDRLQPPDVLSFLWPDESIWGYVIFKHERGFCEPLSLSSRLGKAVTWAFTRKPKLPGELGIDPFTPAGLSATYGPVADAEAADVLIEYLQVPVQQLGTPTRVVSRFEPDPTYLAYIVRATAHEGDYPAARFPRLDCGGMPRTYLAEATGQLGLIRPFDGKPNASLLARRLRSDEAIHLTAMLHYGPESPEARAAIEKHPRSPSLQPPGAIGGSSVTEVSHLWPGTCIWGHLIFERPAGDDEPPALSADCGKTVTWCIVENPDLAVEVYAAELAAKLDEAKRDKERPGAPDFPSPLDEQRESKQSSR